MGPMRSRNAQDWEDVNDVEMYHKVVSDYTAARPNSTRLDEPILKPRDFELTILDDDEDWLVLAVFIVCLYLMGPMLLTVRVPRQATSRQHPTRRKVGGLCHDPA
jgi:hypothetical protein